MLITSKFAKTDSNTVKNITVDCAYYSFKHDDSITTVFLASRGRELRMKLSIDETKALIVKLQKSLTE